LAVLAELPRKSEIASPPNFVQHYNGAARRGGADVSASPICSAQLIPLGSAWLSRLPVNRVAVTDAERLSDQQQ